VRKGIGNANNRRQRNLHPLRILGSELEPAVGYRELFYNETFLGSSAIADGQNDGDASADVQLMKAWTEPARR